MIDFIRIMWCQLIFLFKWKNAQTKQVENFIEKFNLKGKGVIDVCCGDGGYIMCVKEYRIQTFI